MKFSTVLLLLESTSAALQTLPPVTWKYSPTRKYFDLATPRVRKIYVDAFAAGYKDADGLTLIPPTTLEFATTFSADLEAAFNISFEVEVVRAMPEGGIFLTLLDGYARPSFRYQSGLLSSEGYELEVGPELLVIRGAGARGIWWGTRTVIQEALLSKERKVRAGMLRDVPAVVTRGFMLDAGRKWYSASFLKDLCTYASFFKLNEFQYHISDNYPLNRGHNETWNKIYSQFSLYPQNAALQGIITRKNETLSREEFEDFQTHCARRGITVIPEIEAPGHALSITKWKPQLALEKKDLLNLTHPETIPTVKAIWSEFLPWFQTREVHLGADEYDSTMADVYIDFVNTMDAFIRAISEQMKAVRIWGTNEPSTTKAISRSVKIQHWQYGESDPVALAKGGYDVINSEDWWGYISIKNDHTPIFPAPYPQHFNVTRTLNFADQPGWQWAPSLFNPFNFTAQFQLPETSGRNKGAVIASWNDNGPDASTQLEAYYAWREGMPVVAARMWTGTRGAALNISSLSRSVELLAAAAPGQNLDRRTVPTEIDWIRTRDDNQTLGYGSKGMNHTLIITYDSPFTLTSNDTTLLLTTGGRLHYLADGFHYPLRSIDPAAGYDPGHPGRIWSNDTSSTHQEVSVPLSGELIIKTDPIGGSRAWMSDGSGQERFGGRFEVLVFGGRNTVTSWSQMAFVAPLDRAAGGVARIRAVDGLDGYSR
ncbi:beta-N-hexosaminidase [Sphaerosporella brunnea]|uniref:beta-N-acetylhexosaminidase n=1 Tax=Sphaerosporella brunnea TaxID=1250544 RepID=A0A5J5EJD3_9PEZI|nr:beta-N-hexosaminidase [Sphaerosporella brunnea]